MAATTRPLRDRGRRFFPPCVSLIPHPQLIAVMDCAMSLTGRCAALGPQIRGRPDPGNSGEISTLSNRGTVTDVMKGA
ncbi:hypothetical protein GCM10012280_01820 [Wenjunlia tyrosinilytica]|uniref:Uncharacterized protein n=1 Tax=Wenjunlia tyrosinilytica TaxID=1544741 RepID=A0A917ZEC3_9ACTN|nr:hypothetical protein GCM10012280_01820 [Wenjunlia tyrosinilytica]